MKANPITIDPTSLAVEAVGIMNDKKITSIFVCNQQSKKPMGILHIHECLREGVDI